MGKEPGDERVFLDRLHRERSQRKRDRERRVIPRRARRGRADERGMCVVDPDGAVDQARQFEIVGTGFELDQQPVARRSG